LVGFEAGFNLDRTGLKLTSEIPQKSVGQRSRLPVPLESETPALLQNTSIVISGLPFTPFSFQIQARGAFNNNAQPLLTALHRSRTLLAAHNCSRTALKPLRSLSASTGQRVGVRCRSAPPARHPPSLAPTPRLTSTIPPSTFTSAPRYRPAPSPISQFCQKGLKTRRTNTLGQMRTRACLPGKRPNAPP